MPSSRKEPLVTGEIYHIFNKSIGGIDTFTNKRELARILDLLAYYSTQQKTKYSAYRDLDQEAKIAYQQISSDNLRLVEIYSYAIMPNHYHLLLSQKTEGGISRFISNTQNAFAKYFNKKHNRVGSLFLKPFRSKLIQDENVILHVSRYIHLNPVTSYLKTLDQLGKDAGTSYIDYFGQARENFIETRKIISLAGGKSKYVNFVNNQKNYQQKLAKIKTFTLE